MKVEAQPKSFFSSDLVLKEGGREIGLIDNSNWRERALMDVQGRAFTIRRDGLTGPFMLREDETVLAQARKPSAFKSRFEIEIGGVSYELKKRSFAQRAFDLFEDGHCIGTVDRQSWFSRRIWAELPRQMPFEHAAFVLWLAFLIWRRQSNGAG